MDDTRTPLTPPFASDELLTPGETNVAAGYASGLIGKEIADRLCVSHATVVKRTQSIYDKVGCRRSTNALAAWFIAVNARLDLRELERRLGAFFFLILLSLQMAADPAGDEFVRRAPGRRIEARARRGRRRNEEDALELTTF